MSAVRKSNSFLIAARASNGVIGYQGDIPWHAPHDLRLFGRMTRGAVLVMGRATHESLPGILPGRTSIVLSSRPIEQDGIFHASSFEEAVDLALGAHSPTNTIAFIGGETIYRQALKLDWLHRAYITDVDVEPLGDSYFPELGSEWALQDRFDLDPGSAPQCQFSEYRRNSINPAKEATS